MIRRQTYRPCLETLEERTLLSLNGVTQVGFDTAQDWLSIVGETAQVSASADGALAVTVDGVLDIALTGIRAADLRGISLSGAAADTLTLGDLSTSTDLVVNSAGRVTIVGQVHAAGNIDVRADSVLDTGMLDAGGAVQIDFSASYIDTTAARTSASAIRIDGGSTGRLFASGHFIVTGNTASGGSIDLFGKDIFLIGASADGGHGGEIRVGGDYQGANPVVLNAQTVDVSATSALFADGGGRVIVWSEACTAFAGTVSAQGGGFIEVSSHGDLAFSGQADAGAGGTLLLDPKNLVVSAAAGPLPQYNLVNPGSGGTFGADVVPLSTGNVVVTDPTMNSNGGAVYLFNGLSGALISVLSGNPGDQVGSGGDPSDYPLATIALTNGNFVVSSPHWSGGMGAATWGSGASGVSGTVSAANSLVGSHAKDNEGTIAPLSNGNYVVSSSSWNGNLGAATWGNGTTGIDGVVAAANSLVGSNSGDNVGDVAPLTNGNYVVDSADWGDFRGAVTFANGMTGLVGTVSAANSLVGTTPLDAVGEYGVTPLANGNYVVKSIAWNGDMGAATWGNGTTGVVGPVSAANSLVGTTGIAPDGALTGDDVGGYVTPLANGDYVVTSNSWSRGRGAATWGNGMTGVVGPVSAANSLVGTTFGDSVGMGGATALTNGNYVVESPMWNGSMGAVTWGNGNSGVVGIVSPANSLVGGTSGYSGEFVNGNVPGGGVTALTNGNYVVSSPTWNSNLGAATWGDGSAGIVGAISASNSLVGTTPAPPGETNGDRVGSGGVTALTNGNYVVSSSSWNGNLGAATWGNGGTGIAGAVSAANSLVGTNADDMVSGSTFGAALASGGVTALTNGNYVVDSPEWNGGQYRGLGAATWGNGATGIAGPVSPANSFVGASAGDFVGGDYVSTSGTIAVGGVTALSNGNYVVSSPLWNGSQGAVTWFAGTTGKSLDGGDTIDPQNSVVGQAVLIFFTNTAVEDTVNHTFLLRFGTAGGRVTASLDNPALITFSRAQSQTINVTPAFLTQTLDAGTSVTLQANDDITIANPITITPTGTAGDLTIRAGRSIFLDASINTAGGNLTLIANDTAADGVVDSQRDPGNAGITMLSGVALNTGGGALSIDIKHSTDKTNNGQGAAVLTNFAPATTSLSATTALGFILNGTTPGDGTAAETYTQLNVTGPLNLSGIALQITHTPAGATAGAAFTIVHTTGGVTGIFIGLAEGATVTAQDGSKFTISYLANGGNDVTLTAITPPGFSYDALHQVLNITGSAVSNTFTYFQGSAVDGSGTLQTTCDFTLNGATIAYPQSQLSGVNANGQGANSTAVFITNDTYVGSDGQTHETAETVVLGPGGGSLNKPNAAGTVQTFVQLNGFSTSYAYVGHADSAILVGTPYPVVQSIFVTAGNYSYIFGGGQFHLVSGAKYVYGYGSNNSESDPVDQAWQYDAAGSLDAFVASGNAYSYMSGSDTNGNTFFNEAVGFQVTYGIATHGNAIAYMLDSPGNDTFFGTATYSYMSGSDSTGSLFNVAEGFALIYAESFVGGTDFAYNYDPNHNILNSRWILLT